MQSLDPSVIGSCRPLGTEWNFDTQFSLPASPQLEHWTLPNGVRIVEAEMPDAPLTCLDLWCQAGSSSEQPRRKEAHFLEHMVFKSQELPAGAFDRQIEALGGSSNAATGFDDVHFHVMIPSEQAPRARSCY